MKSKEPLFPYQNLFITARPGMGATTLATNIIRKYLDEGKKCLAFENQDSFYTNYIERIKAIRENININIRPYFKKYGNLTITYHYLFSPDRVLSDIAKHGADVIVYEDPYYLKDQSKKLIKLAKELRRMGKIFIFVTHIKRRYYPFTHTQKTTLSISRYRKAIPYFDVSAIFWGVCYDEPKEIRIYEQGKKKYRTVTVEFDFQHQRIKLE